MGPILSTVRSRRVKLTLQVKCWGGGKRLAYERGYAFRTGGPLFSRLKHVLAISDRIEPMALSHPATNCQVQHTGTQNKIAGTPEKLTCRLIAIRLEAIAINGGQARLIAPRC